jgi:hypothetical protein
MLTKPDKHKTTVNDFYTTHPWQTCKCSTKWMYLNKQSKCILCHQEQRLKVLKEDNYDIGVWIANRNIQKLKGVAKPDYLKCINCSKKINNPDKVVKLCNECFVIQISRNDRFSYQIEMYEREIAKEKRRIMKDKENKESEGENWRINTRRD